MNCKACNLNVNPGDRLLCNSCKGVYHYQCLNMTHSTYMNNFVRCKKPWTCEACLNVTRRTGRKDNTPVRHQFQTAEPVTQEMNMSCDDLPQQEESAREIKSAHSQNSPNAAGTSAKRAAEMRSTSQQVTLASIQELLNSTLDTKLSEFRNQLESSIKQEVLSLVQHEIKTLQSDFTETTDFLQAEQNDLKVNVEKTNDSIKLLENRIDSMQGEMTILKTKLMNAERLTRSQNVELQSVPETKNENVLHIVNKICETVGFPLTNSEVIHCRRIAKMNPASPKPRSILITLPTPRHRDNFISAIRRFNKSHPKDLLSSNHIGITTNASRIYVSEHLSPECKMLHAAARKFSKENSYQFVWVTFGRVYLRKNEKSGPILVKDMETLNKLT